MQREPNTMLVTIGVTSAGSTEISMDHYAGGSFELPAISGTTAVTFYAQVGDQAYGIMNDDDGQPIPAMGVSASLPYSLPPNAYNYPRVKIVASTGAATTEVPVYLKS